jgi:hypothetical protein
MSNSNGPVRINKRPATTEFNRRLITRCPAAHSRDVLCHRLRRDEPTELLLAMSKAYEAVGACPSFVPLRSNNREKRTNLRRKEFRILTIC